MKIREILGRLQSIESTERYAGENAKGDFKEHTAAAHFRNAHALDIAIAVLEDTGTDAIIYRGEFIRCAAPVIEKSIREAISGERD